MFCLFWHVFEGSSFFWVDDRLDEKRWLLPSFRFFPHCLGTFLHFIAQRHLAKSWALMRCQLWLDAKLGGKTSTFRLVIQQLGLEICCWLQSDPSTEFLCQGTSSQRHSSKPSKFISQRLSSSSSFKHIADSTKIVHKTLLKDHLPSGFSQQKDHLPANHGLRPNPPLLKETLRGATGHGAHHGMVLLRCLRVGQGPQEAVDPYYLMLRWLNI